MLLLREKEWFSLETVLSFAFLYGAWCLEDFEMPFAKRSVIFMNLGCFLQKLPKSRWWSKIQEHMACNFHYSLIKATLVGQIPCAEEMSTRRSLGFIAVSEDP